MRVLLVESDLQLARCVGEGLRRQGFEVDHVTTGAEALRSCPQADVVLLDLGVPGLRGLRLCRDIRAVSSVPVLAVSADGSEATRVRALRSGADVCLDKPYGFRELVARIEAVTRRTRAARPHDTVPVHEISPVSIDAVAREARVGGRCLTLTEKEFDLLRLLVSQAGTVVSRDQIMLQVWGETQNRRSRTVDTHIASLRRKLGDGGRWIVTVRGVGFRFAPPGNPTPIRPAEGPVQSTVTRPGGRGVGLVGTAGAVRTVQPTIRARDRIGRERHLSRATSAHRIHN
ncbi:response regulator transcription factor [Streptomyces sp. Ru62]|uniref:response regulator transcription factor n=1 Tax=Streptomyces sp. Ru62 TaxID=2080745 RepID=UPI0021566CE4|nr:response regulator transcription factor [Streptomyces sp. Ru62]